MTDTAKTVTETVVNEVKKVGMVKLPRDEYEELVRKAARPIVQNVTRVVKTNAQNAADNKAWGVVLVVTGTACAASGFLLYKHGKKYS